MTISISPAQTFLLLESVSFMRNSVRGPRDRLSSPGLAGQWQHRSSALRERLPDAPAAPGMTTPVVSGPPPHSPLNATLFDDALPFLHFLVDEGYELGRAHLHDLRALAGEMLLHLVGFLHRGDLFVQLLDDRGWGPGGRPDAPPVDRFIAGHTRFRDRGNVGQNRVAGQSAGAGRPQIRGGGVR